MKLVDKNSNSKWDEKVKIELTLREVQILFDSIGSTSWKDFENNWSMYDVPKSDMPYNLDDIDSTFDQLQDIVEELGGVTVG